MTTNIVPIDEKLIGLIRGSFTQGGGLQPFVREILLIECQVAGTSHRDLASVEPTLVEGSLLLLTREAENAHDERAIQILDEAGHFLGYVPKAKNEALANLMDAGKLLFGALDAKEWRGRWLKLDMRVFLRDW